jgi:hypothetical protein
MNLLFEFYAFYCPINESEKVHDVSVRKEELFSADGSRGVSRSHEGFHLSTLRLPHIPQFVRAIVLARSAPRGGGPVSSTAAVEIALRFPNIDCFVQGEC